MAVAGVSRSDYTTATAAVTNLVRNKSQVVAEIARSSQEGLLEQPEVRNLHKLANKHGKIHNKDRLHTVSMWSKTVVLISQQRSRRFFLYIFFWLGGGGGRQVNAQDGLK